MSVQRPQNAPAGNALAPQMQGPPPSGNALAAAGSGPWPSSPPPPPPTHQQTVVALKHFHAIEAELTTLLKNQDVGRADIRSAVIDGVTRLVADRFMSVTQAVNQLTSFPDRPYDQKQWLQEHLATTIQASTAVLDHHRAGFGGQQVDESLPDPDDHLNTIAGLTSGYQGAAHA